MPIHDWSLVDAGIFHHFHQTWAIELANTLNAGGLPPGFFAMAEQIVSGPIPDVVTLQRLPPKAVRPASGGLAVEEVPPKARFVTSAELDRYARKADRITIKHGLGQVVAVLEIVSPGNKGSGHALRSFVQKAEQFCARVSTYSSWICFRLRHVIRRAFIKRSGTRFKRSRLSCRPTSR